MTDKTMTREQWAHLTQHNRDKFLRSLVACDKPVEASAKRVGRRVVGSWMSRLLNKLFPPTR